MLFCISLLIIKKEKEKIVIELLLSEPEKKFEYEKPTMRNAERLQKTITEILDMSKIDNNALTLNKEKFNLN
jgi:signal transduction histidine kinase